MTLSIASNRKFGVEIEFVGITIYQAIEALVGAGIPVNERNSNNYNHVNSSTEWKVVTDATVSGGEVVSPILSGIEGLEQVRIAADAINAAGGTANRSCGLHVHVDARDLTGRCVANAVARYAKFETDIDACMPVSRREGNNGMCQPVGARVKSKMAQLASSEVPVTIVGAVNAFGGDRFRKINICSFTTHGTIEIRQHSGTVQSSKIIPWIQFCVNFVEKSRVQTEVARASRTVANVRRARDSKTLVALHKIVNCLRNTGYVGASQETLSYVTGVKASSCVVYVSNLRTQYGFNIKKRHGNYVLHVNGRLPVLQADSSPVAETPISERIISAPVNDGPFRGLDAGVSSYFSERAADLAVA